MYRESRRSLLLPDALQRELSAACDAAGCRRRAFCKGIYLFKIRRAKGKARVQLFGSGPILNEALKAQQILAEKYNVAADVWSVTSYNELRREALKVERWNRLHPAEPAEEAIYSSRRSKARRVRSSRLPTT